MILLTPLASETLLSLVWSPRVKRGWRSWEWLTWLRRWDRDPRELSLVVCPWPWFLAQRRWREASSRSQSVSGASPSAANDICHSYPHAIFFEPLTQSKKQSLFFSPRKKMSANPLAELLPDPKNSYSLHLNPCSSLSLFASFFSWSPSCKLHHHL